MNQKEKTYSILLVSATTSFASALTNIFQEQRYSPVHITTNINTAKQTMSEKKYDFVIIHTSLPSDTEIRFAINICNSRQTVVLFITKNEFYAELHNKVAKYGIFTLPKPLPRPTLVQALHWMESAREQLRQLEKNFLSIEEKKTELSLINRAKWLLIDNLKLSEADAHHYIEKQAMDYCLPKKAIVENIIQTYSY